MLNSARKIRQESRADAERSEMQIKVIESRGEEGNKYIELKGFSFRNKYRERFIRYISRANDQCVISIISSREREREMDGLFLTLRIRANTSFLNICFHIIVTAFSCSRRALLLQHKKRKDPSYIVSIVYF